MILLHCAVNCGDYTHDHISGGNGIVPGIDTFRSDILLQSLDLCNAYTKDAQMKTPPVDVDRGADVTIIALEFWHPNCPLQEENVQLLGIGTLSQVKQSARWLECIGPEEQRAKLKPCVADI
ncbi:hypothetical protein STEG23_002098, partial [Scotinomys teguina]